MKHTELLDLAVKAINERPPSPSGKWAVVYSKGAVRCIPTLNQCKPEIVFGVYTALELDGGITPRQWDLLKLHMYTFLSEKGLCEKLSKL